MRSEFYGNIHALADKVVKAESVEYIREMSRSGEFSSLFEGKYSDYAQAYFLSDLIKKGAKDEAVEFFLDQNMKTYTNEPYVDEAGDFHPLWENVLEEAMYYKRDNLAKQIADIQVNTIFKDYGASFNGKGSKEVYDRAVQEAYGICSEKYTLKFNDMALSMMEQKKSLNHVAKFVEQHHEVMNYDTLFKYIDYCDYKNISIDDYKNISNDRKVLNVENAFKYIGKKCANIEQVQRVLDKIKINENPEIPDACLEIFSDGVFHSNKNSEAVIYAYEYMSKTKNRGFIFDIMSLEAAEIFYKKGIISIETLGESCLINEDVKRFEELIKNGMDINEISMDWPIDFCSVTSINTQTKNKFKDLFIKYANDETNWKYYPQAWFDALKDNDPQRCFKVLLPDAGKKSVQPYIKELLAEKGVKLSAEDIQQLARQESFLVYIDSDKKFLQETGYLEAYVAAQEQIKMEKLVPEIPYMSKEKQAETLEKYGNNKEVVKALFVSGMEIPAEKLKAMFTAEELAEVRMNAKIQADMAANEKKSAELTLTQRALEQKEKQIDDREAAVKSERSTSVNAAEDIKNLTDEQKRDNFAAKKKLMTEHPIMLEPCLNSMCESYVFTKDEAIKKEMLGELYAVRKGGKTDAEKRDMAKTFKRVLDKNPVLKKDENLVALSKIDTVFSKPTNKVKAQTTRS